MKDVVIKLGVYGHRTAANRVQPVAKGDPVTVSDAEAARLIALGVAVYANAPVEAPNVPLAPPSGGGEEPGMSQDVPGADPGTRATTGGKEADQDEVEVVRLERMQKVDLEQMAIDLGVDISGAKTKHDLAVLIVAAGEPDDGETPPDLGAGDIVQ